MCYILYLLNFQQTGPGLVPAADAYATLDTASNGRMVSSEK